MKLKVKQQGDKTLIKHGRRIRATIAPHSSGGYSYKFGTPLSNGLEFYSVNPPLTKQQAIDRAMQSINGSPI